MFSFDYEKIESDNKYLKEMLETFLSQGIVKLCNAPIEKNFVEQFAYQLGCVREIVFDRIADIVIKKDAYTQGFTLVDLPLHTDC
ncbi:hypothetical protein [Marinomonas sp. 2405UD68-3]|uniref:hypothetical protein n=1 Tax=Marinomonas sp. 2405UD68-3 TaxID=3391835 RepID=UPI0039C8C2D4